MTKDFSILIDDPELINEEPTPMLERTPPDTFDLELQVEILHNKAEELRQYILEELPYNQIYTITGEVNRSTRWGYILFMLNNLNANLKNLGF